MKNNHKNITLIWLLLAPTITCMAQASTAGAAPVTPDTHTDIFMYSLALVMVVTIIAALLTLTSAVFKMSDIMRIDMMKAKGTYVEPEPKEDLLTRFLNSFGKKLTDRVPMEQEASIDMGHDYDGIRELDNNLPPWWIAMFVLSIFFAFGYIYYYHAGGDGKSAKQLYAEEVEDARLAKLERLSQHAEMVNEESATVLTDANSIAAGKATFLSVCKSCHGDNAQGDVGPNLTDDYWLHGGGIHNVFKTIKYGYPAKGMISWEAQLSPRKIQEVASYILSLKGSNPANAKAPQGDIYTPEKDSTKAPIDSTKVVTTDTTSKVANK